MKTLFKVKYKEIVYCNITIIYNKKEIQIKRVVWKNIGDIMFNQKRHLNPLKIKQPCEIINLQILKLLGYENGYSYKN